MGRLGSQRQLGIVRREGFRLRGRDWRAPFDRAIAVGVHQTPPDAERRAFSSFGLRERALAQDRDELLAERPTLLLLDVALETEQAPLGYLTRGDFPHDGPLPAQSADEVAGQPAARVVCRLGVAPVLSDARRRIGRIAREQLL